MLISCENVCFEFISFSCHKLYCSPLPLSICVSLREPAHRKRRWILHMLWLIFLHVSSKSRSRRSLWIRSEWCDAVVLSVLIQHNETLTSDRMVDVWAEDIKLSTINFIKDLWMCISLHLSWTRPPKSVRLQIIFEWAANSEEIGKFVVFYDTIWFGVMGVKDRGGNERGKFTHRSTERNGW